MRGFGVEWSLRIFGYGSILDCDGNFKKPLQADARAAEPVERGSTDRDTVECFAVFNRRVDVQRH